MSGRKHEIYLSVAEFAARTGLAEQTIRRKLRAGEIPGAIEPGDWRIPADAKIKKLPRGRPRRQGKAPE